jgi:predicted O-linked N-acetylglucosamine transferase (SPINDLY family)
MSDSLLHNANSLLQLGRMPEALSCYEAYLKSHPDSAEAWHNLGVTLSQMKRYLEAVASFDRVLNLRPDSAQTRSNRGNALLEQKRFEEACSDYDKALALDPDIPNVCGYRLLAKLSCCDWRDLEEKKDEIAAAIRVGKRAIQPFGNLMISRDPADQLRCARIWTSRRNAPPPLWRGERYEHDKVRVAYISGDFRVHPVGILIAGVFEHHDDDRFEMIAVSFGPDDRSKLRSRIASSVGQFIDARGKDDFQIASRLREMKIDIAVDLMGLTGDCRDGILAHRPAPVQVNYLGFPGTTALPEMDYLIADRTVIPENERDCYTEKIVYLPDTYLPSDSQRRIGERIFRRAEEGLPEAGFVFASFNNSFKFTPEVFAVWMRLLSAVDGSVLWLSEPDAVAVRNLKREAEARGINADRLVFARYVASIDEHLARSSLADLFLDTLPCNAHTTASDALWVGLPVITARGTTFAGRVAASLLQTIGLDELIANSLAEYEALALKLARNADALARVKRKLKQNRETHPLFDTARFTRNLERAFMAMCERARRGASPESFAVESAP